MMMHYDATYGNTHTREGIHQRCIVLMIIIIIIIAIIPQVQYKGRNLNFCPGP